MPRSKVLLNMLQAVHGERTPCGGIRGCCWGSRLFFESLPTLSQQLPPRKCSLALCSCTTAEARVVLPAPPISTTVWRASAFFGSMRSPIVS